jgi:hypothetical protein
MSPALHQILLGCLNKKWELRNAYKILVGNPDAKTGDLNLDDGSII